MPLLDQLGESLNRRATFKFLGRGALVIGAALAGLAGLAVPAAADIQCCTGATCSGCTQCSTCSGEGGVSNTLVAYCWTCNQNGQSYACYDCRTYCNNGSYVTCCLSSAQLV